MNVPAAEFLIAVANLNCRGGIDLAVDVSFDREGLVGCHVAGSHDRLHPCVAIRPGLQRQRVNADTFALEPRKRVRDVTEIFVSVRDEHEPLEMMRREILNGALDRSFQVRRALIDRVIAGVVGHSHFIHLIQCLEDGCIGAERNVPGVIRMSRIVGLPNPLNGRLDGSR